MLEDCQIEDEAEKLAESPSEAIIEFLNEHDTISRKDLIELLIERCDLSKDEAEKIFEDYIARKKLRYSKGKGGYVWSEASTRQPRMPKFPGRRGLSPRRKSRASIGAVLRAIHLPPDPHTLPVKSYFLARDNPGQPYYHPAMDQDKLAYLRAKEKMGAGADWPA